MFPSRLRALANVNEGTETIDRVALASCIASYERIATTCKSTPLATACRGLFVGTKSEGASCGVGGSPMTIGSGECRANGGAVMCVWTGGVSAPTASGVCHTPTRDKRGDSCAASCASNEDCFFDMGTSPGHSTTVCFEADDLYCTNSSSPVCAPIVAAGSSCVADSFSCASNSYCDDSASPLPAG